MVLSIKGKDQLVVGFKCLSPNRLLHRGSVKHKKPANYKQAIEIAREWSKPLLIVFTDSNCPWCEKFKETLQDSRVKDYLDSFVLFEVKWQKNQYLCHKYSVVSYPSYKIVDVSGENGLIWRHGSGYRNVEDFIAWIGADFKSS